MKDYSFLLVEYSVKSLLIEYFSVISKEDMDRLVAEKKPQGYGPVVAEASSCSNDEVRKMHQTLVSVNANR